MPFQVSRYSCGIHRNKVCTLIQEYHPGPEKLLYGTINGQYEDSEGGKHQSAKECAIFELAEEALLEAKEEDIISMLPEGITTPMDKYTDNKFHLSCAESCTCQERQL